ncbi:MAG: HEAT repeat domain-containing protein [Cyclobacteriaceae bacterium]
MLKAFLKFLGGEEGEERQMWLLLGYGFFLGVFLATYQVSSESLFIQALGEQYLDTAFFAAGGLGIIATALYVFLQRKIRYSSLVVSIGFLMMLFVAGVRAAFYYFPAASSESGFEYLPFILFVMMGPVTAISLLVFWGIFGRMFDTRQAKRIIGGIDTGQLTATIIAFFSIPLITRLPFVDETYDLLFVSGVACFAILVFIILISISWNIDKSTRVGKEEEVEKVTYGTIFKDKYTRLLSIFLIFTVGASVFIEFTFLSATETYHTNPETGAIKEQDLNDFLSFFSGIVVIMSFLIQSFLNDLIIGKFGLRIALMVYPAILILFMIGAIISGHIYGYEEANKEFLFFFMFAVSGKAFTASLRDALEQPAFKLFFLPFDIKIRFDVQSRVEGVVNEFATLAAGGVQMLLGLLVWFKLIHYSYFLIAIAAMVMWLAHKLYGQYKITLAKTLKKQRDALHGEGKRNEHNSVNILKEQTRTRDENRIINALRLFEKIDPIQFQFALLDQLGSKSTFVRQYAYQKVLEHQIFEALEVVKREFATEGDEEVVEVGKKAIEDLEAMAAYELNNESIRQLVRSTDYKERIKGARLLSKITDDAHAAFIIELLRDINPEVRIAAIISAGKTKRPEFWQILIENLHSSTYANAVVSALVYCGEAAFHNVDTSFYKTGQYHSTMLRIVQILGQVRGNQATELLWKKIDTPNKHIVSQLLLSLSYIGFNAKDFQAARIKLFVEAFIGDIAWNIKAMKDIPNLYPVHPMDKMLRQAMEEEDARSYNNIFMLMGMIYDPQNVVLVKENIEADTTDGVTFAVEMMDVFLDDELKPKVFPVMDDLKDEQRLEKLMEFYPPEDFESYIDLLEQIINRSYNRITRYTKALCLHRLSQLDGVEVTNDLIANLFNPDPLLLQTAAHTIYVIDENSYHVNTKRLKPSVKKELDSAILPPVFLKEGEDYHKKSLIIERVFFLKSMVEFQDLAGELVTFIADVMEEIRVQKGTYLINQGDRGTIPLYMMVKGAAVVKKGDEVVQDLKVHQLIGEKMFLDSEAYDFDVVTTEETTLFVLNKEDIFDLMSKHLDIMETFVGILNDEFVAEEVAEDEFDMSIFD